MAKRTTHRSSKGKKLYAVRTKEGAFKDIQTYRRAHGSDVKRRAKAELHGRYQWKRDPEVTAFMKTFRGFITSHFGKRCATVENGCGCCQMWKAYDLVDTMIV